MKPFLASSHVFPLCTKQQTHFLSRGLSSIHSNGVIRITCKPAGQSGVPTLLLSPSASIIARSVRVPLRATLLQTAPLGWHVGTQQPSCDGFSGERAKLGGRGWAGPRLGYRTNLIFSFSSNTNWCPSSETGERLSQYWMHLLYYTSSSPRPPVAPLIYLRESEPLADTSAWMENMRDRESELEILESEAAEEREGKLISGHRGSTYWMAAIPTCFTSLPSWWLSGAAEPELNHEWSARSRGFIRRTLCDPLNCLWHATQHALLTYVAIM